MLGLLAAVSLAACGQSSASDLDIAGLQALLAQGAPLYDVRRPEEWRQTGVVAGSRLLTGTDAMGRARPQFVAALAAQGVDKDRPLVLICRSGSRTGRLVRELRQTHGYTQVFHLERGIIGWLGGGQPVVAP